MTAFELTFNDAVMVTLGDQIVGVYWLRTYRSAAESVAIVTEVPGNPGRSSTNAISRIASQLIAMELVPTGRTRWFICYPGGLSSDQTIYSEVAIGPDGSPAWKEPEIERGHIESLLGLRLTLLPSHDETLRRVLEIGGQLAPPPSVIRWRVMPRESLPPPENPFRCDLHREYLDFTRDRIGTDDERQRRAVGAAFFDTLTPADYARCRWHEGDWWLIADAATTIIRTLGPDADLDSIHAAIREMSLPPSERRWVASVFDDPMWWNDEGYGNGQHRGCALRASDVELVVMATFEAGTGPGGTWVIADDA